MNDHHPVPATRLEELTFAAKGGFGALLASTCCLNALFMYYVPEFQEISRSMVGSRPVSTTTQFVIEWHEPLLILALGLLAAGLVVFYVKSIRSVTIMGALLLTAILQLFLNCSAIFSMIIKIVHTMAGSAM